MTNASPSPITRDALYEMLSDVTFADERAFRRRLHRARSPQALEAIAKDVHRAVEKRQLIDIGVPEITYPETLPVSARREDIAEAIENNQVVIIAGETGSGKTTQIPKICLDLGRGRRGLIGHTQPRRLAARTVAERIAEELGQPIGETVGYAIRFDDRVSPTSAVKLMTDGILLAEMQRDRFLNAYDTIIIDEAHERSLNIDFILGYLKRLLPKRPDLKVIITSATIDPESFAEHFAAASGEPAPIIEVSAMFVDRTMRRPECGSKTRCCSWFDRRPNRGVTSTPRHLRPSMASIASRMSRSPGKKQRMSPGPSSMSSSQASHSASRGSWSTTLPSRSNSIGR